MRFSHILYKVKNQEEAVKDFEAMGFTVSRGGVNPKIWFEDGSFIELFDIKMSNFVFSLMRIFGLKEMANKFSYFKKADYGFVDYSLEVDGFELDDEHAKLKQMGYKFCTKLLKVKDRASGSKLKWRISFIEDLKMPFLVAVGDFMESAKPKEIAHKNGAKAIEKVVWGADPKQIRDISELCNDERLVLVEGDGFQEIKIAGFTGDVFSKKYYK